MGNSRRVFSPEFRGEAVKLVVDTGRPVARVARELGILEGTLGNWSLVEMALFSVLFGMSASELFEPLAT